MPQLAKPVTKPAMPVHLDKKGVVPRLDTRTPGMARMLPPPKIKEAVASMRPRMILKLAEMKLRKSWKDAIAYAPFEPKYKTDPTAPQKSWSDARRAESYRKAGRLDTIVTPPAAITR